MCVFGPRLSSLLRRWIHKITVETLTYISVMKGNVYGQIHTISGRVWMAFLYQGTMGHMLDRFMVQSSSWCAECLTEG